jgi:hypothetical protein
LGGDGRLQSGDPGLEAVDGVILLLVGAAESPALRGDNPDGVGLLRQLDVSVVGVFAGVVEVDAGLAQHEVKMINMVAKLRVRRQVHWHSEGVVPCIVHKATIREVHEVLPAQTCESFLKSPCETIRPVVLPEGELDPCAHWEREPPTKVHHDHPLKLTTGLVIQHSAKDFRWWAPEEL